MRRMLYTILALVLLAAGALVCMSFVRKGAGPNSAATDNATETGHVLAAKWAEYRKASDNDLPQTEEKLLQEIKAEAVERHLPWDFWDAASRIPDVVARRNWKMRDSASRALAKEVQEFDEPIVSFVYMGFSGESTKSRLSFVKENEARLRAGANKAFYSGRVYSSPSWWQVVRKNVSNDYQFALWAISFNRYDSSASEARKILAPYLSYPSSALLEYYPLPGAKRAEYAKKYEGKAVALLARQDILLSEFNTLEQRCNNGAEHPVPDDYRALRQKCDEFKKDQAAFTGEEAEIAKCCTQVKDLAERLDASEVSASIKDSRLTLVFTNVPRVTVCIAQDGKKAAYRKTIANPYRSYYLPDTVSLDLPVIDDGNYVVEAKWGNVEYRAFYSKYTISLARRDDKAGTGIYAADYRTGEPVTRAKVEIKRNDKVIVSDKDFVFKGFTPLSARLQSALDKGSSYGISVSYRDSKGVLHMSGTERFSPWDESAPSEIESAVLLTDRAAFHPGETLQFKAIAYTSDQVEIMAPCPAGVKLHVVLNDPSGETRSELDALTNEFGSISGSFPLVGAEKNGSWSLTVYKDRKFLCSESITVDEFVLPNFEIIFDEDKALHLPGDIVRISGKVASYSGHPLTAATLSGRARESYDGNWPPYEPIEMAPDGSFSFEFKTDPDNSRYYRYVIAEVKLTDATGETAEKRINYSLSRNINPVISFRGEDIGEFTNVKNSTGRGRIALSDTVLLKTIVADKAGMKLEYEVVRQGQKIGGCEASASDYVPVVLSGPSGLYSIVVKASVKNDEGNVFEDSASLDILKLEGWGAAPGESAEGKVKNLADTLENVFVAVPGDGINVKVAATAGKVWAVAELFNSDRTLLESRSFVLSGVPEDDGSLETLSFPYKDSYGDYVALQVFYFRNGRNYEFKRDYRRPVEKTELPLRFTRFEDKAIPSESYSFLIESKPEVECAAAIFDKSTERIRPNVWRGVRIGSSSSARVYYSRVCGNDNTILFALYDEAAQVYESQGVRGDKMMAAAPMRMNKRVEDDATVELVETESIPFMSIDSGVEAPEEVTVRENFATTLAFQPFLRSDKFGNMLLDFTTSDKLSTFVVQLFAHDKAFSNAVLRKEMVVSVPVRVAMVEPQLLYRGDKWFLKGSLSSISETDVPGKVSVEIYDGNNWREAPKLMVRSLEITAPSGAQKAFECEIDVPEVDVMGVKMSFVPDEAALGSDAVFVPIPVLEPSQTLFEAHSAILRGGDDADALIARLSKEFVNTTGADADVRRISIVDMVREALPDVIRTESKDALSLSAALHAGLLAKSLDETVEVNVGQMESALAACRKDDGGFAWFESMASSPAVTAVILQRLYALKQKGLLSQVPVIEAFIPDAVKYLDESYFNANLPFWRGGLSLEQYIYTRSLFAGVSFGASNVSAAKWKEFRKASVEYLMPKKARGLRGAVLSKSRRCLALMNLSESDAAGLLGSWGISLGKTEALRASCLADIRSLLEYAAAHPHGGMYYPNAVMPWRGLMESELSAHVTLCRLLDRVADSATAESAGSESRSGEPAGEAILRLSASASESAKAAEIAEGIRFWMMIQKETQKWGSEPAYIEAIDAVLAGPQETLATEVIALSKSFTKPFDKVKAAGNGFKVSRVYLRDGKSLRDGEILHVGDRITAEYRIWNGENRSFVRLYAPRPASLRPVNQLSGYSGWWSWTSGYRNVLKDRTEYWYDSYPEENTTVREEFYVTQKGVFHAPAVSIESLYAPHYRANGTGVVLHSED